MMHESSSGLAQFWSNLKALPKNLFEGTFRHGAPTSERTRFQAVFNNLFLHIHAARISPRSLKLTTTWTLGVSLFAQILILIVTGILLMVYYVPSIDAAYNSIKDIHYVVPAGRFMRNIHRWAAHLMVVSVVLHMARVFYTAAYKPPREFNWLMGMILFGLTLALSFTGYLLPWDQLAYWAVTIAANIAASFNEVTYALGLPTSINIGDFIKEILLGATVIGQDALTRFYMLHVMLLPLIMLVVASVHIWRVRKDGGLAHPDDSFLSPTPISPGKEAPRKTYSLMAIVKDKGSHTGATPDNTVSSWPYLLRAELAVFMLNLLICLILGWLYDAPLKEAANPAIPENPAKAPWYFLGLQELVSYSAFMGGVAIPTLAMMGLAFIPFLDREQEPSGIWFSGVRGRWITLLSAIVGSIGALCAVAIPVNFGWLRNWFPDIPQIIVILFNPGTLLTALYVGWSLLVIRKTASTRMGAIALFTCFLVGFTILTYVGTYLRGPNWDFYWSESQWPKH